MGSLVDGLKNGGDYSVFSGCFTGFNSCGGGMEWGVGSLKRHFLVSGCLLIQKIIVF